MHLWVCFVFVLGRRWVGRYRYRYSGQLDTHYSFSSSDNTRFDSAFLLLDIRREEESSTDHNQASYSADDF